MERAELSAEDDGVGGSFRLGTLFNVAGTGRDPITGFGGQLRDIIVEIVSRAHSAPHTVAVLWNRSSFGSHARESTDA